MTGPRFLCWVGTKQFYICESLAKAFEWRDKTGGTVYEPLAMTSAEQIGRWDDLIDMAGEALGTDPSLRNIGCVEACIELARKYLSEEKS